MKPQFPTLKRFVTSVLTLLILTIGSFAQTTITTETGTNYSGANGVTGNSAITFNINNTSGGAVLISGIDEYFQTANNNTVCNLWVSTVSLTGTTGGVSAPNWTLIAGPSAPIAVPSNGYYQVFSGLSYLVPNLTEVRFALQSSNGIRYSGATPAPTPDVFTASGVTLICGDGPDGTAPHPGYGGAFPTPTNNPRHFTGRVHFAPAGLCSGIPTPGSTNGPSAICPNVNFSLSVQNATSGTGVSYLWESSPDNITYSAAPGVNINPNYTADQSIATYYRCQVTCAGNGTAASSSLLVGMNSFLTCFCSSIPSNAADEEIYSVTLNGSTTAYSCAAVAPGPGSILNRYSNFTTLAPLTSMMQGQSAAYTVVENECDGATFYAFGTGIWVDWNQNGLLTDPGETILQEASAVIGPRNMLGTLTVPANALPGNTLMRIIVAEGVSGAALIPCLTYSYGETEDHLITVVAAPPCVDPPTAGTAAASATAVCPGTTVLFSVTGTALGSGQTYQWENSPDGSTWTAIAGANNILYNTTINAGAFYRLAVTCGTTSYTNTVQVTLNSFVDCICTSNATSPLNEDVLNVTFGSMANSSICSQLAPGPGSIVSQYSNYKTSVTPAVVAQLQAVPLSVQIGTCGSNSTNWTKVFIDYNHNGLLTDAGEQVYSNAASAVGPNTQSGTVTVPLTALTGQTVMRVVNEATGTAAGVTACGTYTYGETEDYLIDIIPAVPCVDPPSAGVTSGPAGTICPGSTITMTNGGQDIGLGASYLWESSPDGITYTPIAGQTTTLLTTAVPSTTWFRLAVTCGLSTSYSTPYQATTASFSAPYFENFDSSVGPNYVPNNCWSRNPSTGTTIWKFANGTGTPSSDPDYGVENVTDHTTGSGFFAWWDGSNTSPDSSKYITPFINISSLTVPYVRFFRYSNNTNDGAQNRIVLQAWNGGGWTTLGTKQGNFAGWEEVGFTVPPTIPTTTQFRIVAKVSTTGTGSAFYNDQLIDDFSVIEGPPCASPTNPTASGVGSTQATLSWGCSGCTGTFTVEYGPVGFTPGTGATAGVGGTVATSPSSPIILTGLLSGTAYHVYVRQDCLGNGTSFGYNVGPVFFTTAPGCGNLYYDSGGALGQYANNENNTFTICPNTAGDIVQVQFTSFQTENNWDPLYVYNGNSTTAPLIASSNGTSSGGFPAGGWWNNVAPTNTGIPGLVQASNASGCLTFNFRSDGTVTQAGWAANISCITPNLTCAAASPILCGETKQGFTLGGPYNLPASACAFNGTPSSGGVAWYTYTAAADNDVVVSTCGQASFDTRISVLRPLPDCANLECIGGVDNLAGCPGGSTEMTFKAVTGQTYYIAVHGVGTAEGTFSVSLFCVPVCAPGNANDLCANATPLSASLIGTGVPSTGENGCAYVDGPTACSSNLPAQGVWYTFNSGLNTQHTLTLLTAAQNPAYTATTISYALYNGACTSSGAGGELSCYSGAGTSVLALSNNTDYKLLVYNQGGVGVEGTFGVMLERPAIYDASITQVLEPVGLLCDTKFDPVVRLKNLGEVALNDVTIEVRIDGGAPILTYLWNGILAFGDSIDVTLPEVSTPTGNHTLIVTAIDPNGSTDENSANDAASSVYDASGQTVKVRITTDNNGGETTWAIYDANFSLEASGGPYTNNTTVVESVCLSTAFGNQWSFYLFDSFGDGICCANGNGSWALLDRQDQLVLRDQGTFTTQSPSAAPQTPAYAIGHEVMLPLGPVLPATGECGVLDNLLQNKVYVNPVAGVTNYQYEFSNPDGGFRRRVQLARNYVLITDMQSNPLSLGVTYFLRTRADQNAPGVSDDNWGPGCEVGWSASAAYCTQLINTPGPTFSCGVTRTFGGSDKIWAQPVPGVLATPLPGQPTPYQFRFTGTGSNSGYVRNIFRSSYICPLSWVTNPLVSGETYDVQVQVWVGGAWKGFCGNTCQVTINNTPAQGGRTIGETSSTDNVQLWPNPVRDGRVNLRIDGLADAEQNITVDVYDVFGKRVFTQEYGNSGELFNTVLELNSDFSIGLYLVNITVNDRTYTTRISVL